LQELGIGLICVPRPQAKGRIERSFGTAQDRWVKERRLAGVDSAAGAKAVWAWLLPAHNRRFAKAGRETTDAHRPPDSGHELAALWGLQEERVASKDYTVRFQNRFYQLLPPGGGYREREVSSSRAPSVAQTIPAEEVTTSGQGTFLMSPKCRHSYWRLTGVNLLLG
jgi:hypothetical protein